MPLSQEELQELAELEELEALEAEEAQSASRSPALEIKEPGLKSSSFSPAKIPQVVAEWLGLDTNAAGRNAVNSAAMGYAPQIVGGAKAAAGGDYVAERDKAVNQLKQDMKQSPGSSMLGMGAGALATGGAATGAMKPAATGMGRIAQATGMGAGQGALYNPGDKEGVINPIQVGDRAVNAGVGGLTGFLGGLVGEGARKGAQTVQNIRDLKSGAMADRAVSAIDDAAAKLDEKQLAPRRDQLEELIKGRSYEVNPDRVKPVFPRLGDKMAEGLAPEVNPMLGAAPAPDAPARSVLSGDRALRLKRAADSAAGYGASKPFDPAATAKGEEAKSLADILRRQFNADPAVAKLNQESSDIIALKDALLKREGTAPIEMLQPKSGSSNHAVLSKVDNMAGTDLRGLGEQISSSKDLLLDPRRYLRDLQGFDEARKTFVRGAAATGNALDKAPAGTKEATLQTILEAKRRAK